MAEYRPFMIDVLRIESGLVAEVVAFELPGLIDVFAFPECALMTMSDKGLRIALWVLQALLAFFFVMVGYSHALAPFDQVALQGTWLLDVPRALSRFIGYAEVAGGVGLILPAATRRAPWLTPLAAAGLAAIMILAIPFHLVRGEGSVTWMHALIAALALFVVWGRWRGAPIAGL